MSFDPNSITDRADSDPDYGVCPHCKGRGFTFYEKNNPYAVEPCGCDDASDEEEGGDE